MQNVGSPKNDNLVPFSELMRNPQQDRADRVLKAFLHGMKEEGIPRSMRIRTLYEFFMYELSTTADGTGMPDEVEHIENLAIMNEIDERWTIFRNQMKEAWPDLFQPHG